MPRHTVGSPSRRGMTRQLFQTMNQLERLQRLQRLRKGENVPAPLNLQVLGDVPAVLEEEGVDR